MKLKAENSLDGKRLFVVLEIISVHQENYKMR